VEPLFSVQILGSNSALPAYNRHPTSQLLNVNNQYYLIDCGEGTQMQLRRYGLKMQRIKVIFISHLHGDHYFGLIGLLNSFHLLGRKAGLTIVCPEGLKQILELQMDAANGKLQYPISYIFTDHIGDSHEPKLVFSDNHVKVEAFPLKHRVLCCGFMFKETKKLPAFKAELMERYKIPIAAIPGIKHGDDFETEDGQVISNKDLTIPSPEPRTYAYCTDTAPLPHLSDFLKGVNLLYHEATFTEELRSRAKQTFHSTAKQAAEIALQSEVRQLIIGHFSARYKTLEALLQEARETFEQTELAEEGMLFEIQ